LFYSCSEKGARRKRDIRGRSQWKQVTDSNLSSFLKSEVAKSETEIQKWQGNEGQGNRGLETIVEHSPANHSPAKNSLRLLHRLTVRFFGFRISVTVGSQWNRIGASFKWTQSLNNLDYLLQN